MNHLQSFKGSLAYEVGDGRQVKFREDAWCGERSLKKDFPNAFAMATDPKAVVASYFSTHGGEVVWMLALRQDAFDWELSRVTQLWLVTWVASLLGA